MTTDTRVHTAIRKMISSAVTPLAGPKKMVATIQEARPTSPIKACQALTNEKIQRQSVSPAVVPVAQSVKRAAFIATPPTVAPPAAPPVPPPPALPFLSFAQKQSQGDRDMVFTANPLFGRH